MPGEKHRGLSRGVAAADERHLLPRAHLCLDGRGPVPDAPPFERLQIGAVRTAIAGARGDDQRAAAHGARVGELERERIALLRPAAVQAQRLGGDQHARAEFLRLRIGSARKRLARDAGREAEIVLDARARARLPAEGARVDDEHGEPFGGRVDRGRESRRARADDGDVVHALRIGGIQHADAARELVLCGISQHRSVGAGDERHVLGPRRVALDEAVRVRVVGGIEDQVRNAVAGEKTPQPRHVRGRGRTDQHRAACAHLDQADAAQDQRAHDLLAEIGFGDQQRAQLLRDDEERLDRAGRDAVRERAPARELPDFARESSGGELGDEQIVPVPVAAGDAQRAREHDEHARASLPGLEQTLAVRVAARRAEAAQARDLLVREDREHLRAARFERRRVVGLSHRGGDSRGSFQLLVSSSMG